MSEWPWHVRGGRSRPTARAGGHSTLAGVVITTDSEHVYHEGFLRGSYNALHMHG